MVYSHTFSIEGKVEHKTPMQPLIPSQHFRRPPYTASDSPLTAGSQARVRTHSQAELTLIIVSRNNCTQLLSRR